MSYLHIFNSFYCMFFTVLVIPRGRRRDIVLSISVCLSIRSHNQVTVEWNFMKLLLNMYIYHYNDVMHLKFGQAGLGSA